MSSWFVFPVLPQEHRVIYATTPNAGASREAAPPLGRRLALLWQRVDGKPTRIRNARAENGRMVVENLDPANSALPRQPIRLTRGGILYACTPTPRPPPL